MNIELNKQNDLLTVTLKGRLDTNTSPTLEEEINNMDLDVKELVLDIKGLEYISSAGLRVILSAQKKMNKSFMLIMFVWLLVEKVLIGFHKSAKNITSKIALVQ